MQILVFTLYERCHAPQMMGRPFLLKKNNIEPKDIRTKFNWFTCSGVLDMQIL